MAVKAEDLERAKKFCDDLGCSTVHQLRTELPGLLASVREAEQARCTRIVETEQELEGTPPYEAMAAIRTKAEAGAEGILELMRTSVRVTKAVILKRIQS